jgi:SAM-dependent methyltransferase
MECINCLSHQANNFYTLKNSPVQSLVTIKSLEEALAIPKKDISLAFCSDCGFIFNSSFVTRAEMYTQGYEDQQGFSQTWLKFITGVTESFINKYGIRNKDIIEIGCGKGDFLELICQLGNNRGIGIDPAYVPGKLDEKPYLRFIREFYSEKHRNLPADVIVCRHTMEHIYNNRDFIQTIRKAINNNKDVIVLIEVPSIVRILKINAFWDIFYEHCSYFSPGSLSILFRNNGFEVLENYLEYNEQYLFLVAKPVDEKSEFIHPAEETIDQLKTEIDNFIVQISDKLNEWRQLLMKMKSENKKVVVWGGGSKSVGFLTHFNDLDLIKHVVDINPHMQGNFIPGIGIQYVDTKFLHTHKPDVVIIMNGVYEKEIAKMLLEMELTPQLICL